MTRAKKDYSKGKIYEIICLITGERYIGSTCCEYLSQRLRAHKAGFKTWKKSGKPFTSSYPIIGRGNYQILLIENYPCATEDELRSREGYWIRERKGINKVMAGRTMKETLKLYYQANKEHLKNQSKLYYEANKERLTEKKKCECGGNYEKYRISKHKKSKKHIEWESLNSQLSDTDDGEEGSCVATSRTVRLSANYISNI